MELKIKYKEGMPTLEQVKIGNWIDLYTRYDVVLSTPFQFEKIPLGVSIKLPTGYEAIIAPRSSTYERYNVIQTNGIGIIDETYCGNDDEWHFPCIFVPQYSGIILIPKHTRICQFRILKRMNNLEIKKVDFLENQNRGGFGSTGY